jgi:CheY-like chemotaxis protein
MKKILIVQDEEMNVDNLTRRLIRRGYAVHGEAEVEPALKKAAREDFQLVLLDMNLADMDGWEAARRFKENPATRQIPIIGMCNDELDGAEAMAMDAGCVAFEPRPVDLDRLLGKIQAHLPGNAAPNG